MSPPDRLPVEEERAAREAVCEAGRRLHTLGLVAGTAGNLSVRLPDGRVLVTPAGANKGRLEPGNLVPLDPERPTADLLRRASSEWPVHDHAYRTGRAVGAVVHTHAPALTAAGLRDLEIGRELPEIGVGLGGIATVPFAPSGSEALGRSVARALQEGARTVLLRRHGVVTVGTDLEEAIDRMELAELSALAVLLARTAGLELDLGWLTTLLTRAARTGS